MDFNSSLRRPFQSKTYADALLSSKITDGKHEETFGDTQITDAPVDILNLIFDLLLPIEIFRLARTCKAIHRAFLQSSARKKIFFEVSAPQASSWFTQNHVTPVMCHLGFLYNNSFYVVGGDSPQNKVTANFGTVLQEVLKFDLVKRKWENVKVESMQAITEHSGVVLNNSVYMYGGVRPGSVRSGDLLVLNMTNMTLRTETAYGQSPRGSCFACAIRNNCFYAIGGWNPDTKTDKLLIHEYNFETKYWREVRPKGEIPAFRRAHKSVRYGNFLYIFGGLTISGFTNEVVRLDLTNLNWTTVTTTGTGPSPRSRAAICLVNNKMYIHGGWDNSTLSDFFELDLDTFVWRPIPVNNGPAFAQHSLITWNNKMFIFGGNDGEKVSNKLYGIHL